MSVAIEASVSLWDRVDKLWEFLITLKQNTSSYMWNQSEMRKLLAKRAIEKWNVQWLIIYMTKIPIQSFTCCTFLIFINTPQLYFSYSVTRHLHAQSFLISRVGAHLHFAFFILCIINNTQNFFFSHAHTHRPRLRAEETSGTITIQCSKLRRLHHSHQRTHGVLAHCD